MNTDKISLSCIALCLFTVSNFFSPLYYLGDGFARLPFILSVIVAVTHVISRYTDGRPIMRFNLPSIILVLVWAFALNGTFIKSIDVNHSKEYLNYLTKDILLFVLISQVITNIKELKVYIFVLVICAFGNAYKLVYFPIWTNGRAWLEGTASSGDPNILTLVFVYTLPLIVALILVFKNKFIRLILCYFIFVVLLGIIEAQSRGGLVALIIMVVFGLLQIKDKKHRLIATLCVVIIGGLFFTRYAPPEYVDRMLEIIHPETDETGSAQARSSAMYVTSRYILFHPFSEYGLGNHSYFVASEYGVDVLDKDELFRGSYLAHNIFLQFGGDLGLIPLLFYISFTGALFLGLFAVLKNPPTRDQRDVDVIIVMSKSLIISLFGLLSASSFLAGAYQPFLYYIGGCCSALYLSVRHPGGRPPSELGEVLDQQ